MTCGKLPDSDHVVRYASPAKVRDDGSLDGSMFRLRMDEYGLSVNWPEYFGGLDKPQQLDQIRRLIRVNMKPSGRLVELNVGTVMQRISSGFSISPGIYHRPLPASSRYPADPSHSEITGLPPRTSPQSTLIGDLIAECVSARHPAIP